MTETGSQSEKPSRRSDHRVFWWTCGIGLLFVPLVLFLPWDAPMPVAPDLEATPPAVPEAENAFVHFEQAGRFVVSKFKGPDGQDRYFSSDLTFAVGDKNEVWDPSFVQEIMKANAAVFAELEQGLVCPQYAGPKIENVMTPLLWLSNKSKREADLLSLAAKTALLSGKHQEAARRGLQAMKFGQYLCHNGSCLTEWVVGTGYQMEAGVRLEELTSDINTPETVLRELSAALDQWDGAAYVEGYRRATKGDYSVNRRSLSCFTYALTTASMDDGRSGRIEGILEKLPYAWKPKANLQLTVPIYRVLIADADKPLSQASLGNATREKKPDSRLGKLLLYTRPNSLGLYMFFNKQRGFEFSFRRKCQLQALIAALHLKVALRLYEMKHGELPDRLEVLVPDYLQAIPADPYDGHPFRYSKSERKVWAVGKDLKDQGGLMENPRCIMMYDSHGYDLVMPLDVREMKPNLAKPKTPDKEQETSQP